MYNAWTSTTNGKGSAGNSDNDGDAQKEGPEIGDSSWGRLAAFGKIILKRRSHRSQLSWKFHKRCFLMISVKMR